MPVMLEEVEIVAQNYSNLFSDVEVKVSYVHPELEYVVLTLQKASFGLVAETACDIVLDMYNMGDLHRSIHTSHTYLRKRFDMLVLFNSLRHDILTQLSPYVFDPDGLEVSTANPYAILLAIQLQKYGVVAYKFIDQHSMKVAVVDKLGYRILLEYNEANLYG